MDSGERNLRGKWGTNITDLDGDAAAWEQLLSKYEDMSND
jgi:hypothetical protein